MVIYFPLQYINVEELKNYSQQLITFFFFKLIRGFIKKKRIPNVINSKKNTNQKLPVVKMFQVKIMYTIYFLRHIIYSAVKKIKTKFY